MRTETSLDAAHRHVEQDIPIEWIAVETPAGETVVVNEPAEGSVTAYTLAGETDNPRVIAAADAVLWDGVVCHTDYEDGLVCITHTFAGVQERLVPAEFLDERVPLLDRTEAVKLEGER